MCSMDYFGGGLHSGTWECSVVYRFICFPLALSKINRSMFLPPLIPKGPVYGIN